MPSTRLLVALGAVTLLVAVSVAEPRLAVLAFVLDALLFLAFLYDVHAASRTPLTASRQWPPLLVQGAPAELSVRVASRPGVHLRLREGLHPGLAAAPARVALEMTSGLSSWTVPLLPRRRGEHATGPLTARVLGPLGLGWSQREVLPAEPRRVYPQVRWEGDAGRLLALAQRRELGQVPLRLRGLGREPYALREYRPGDPLSRVHWKASARHGGRLVSREDTEERGARLVVLLDCARAMRGVEGERSKLDHALAAALALLRVANGRGDRVTVVAFSDHIERVVRVRAGSRGVAHAYALLYDLPSRLAEPAFDLAAETVLSLEARRSTVVLFTSVVDLASAELLRSSVAALRRRHRTVLVNLEDPELWGLARGAPATVPEAFAKVASLGILLANRDLGRGLRRAGIQAASVPADRLAWEAMQAYLSASRTRR
jgi:uncharacterized protein (DUF58 family)